MSGPDKEVAVTIVEPGKKATFIFSFGTIQDITDYELERYRDETKCFHHVMMYIKIDYTKQHFGVNISCPDCTRAKLSKEVLI
ncbi:MAG TPA: hypothetical protein ENI23_09420 [bacterium]|nr:hypothetical protein [bacterium]